MGSREGGRPGRRFVASAGGRGCERPWPHAVHHMSRSRRLASQVIDGQGLVFIPGMVNTHHHMCAPAACSVVRPACGPGMRSGQHPAASPPDVCVPPGPCAAAAGTRRSRAASRRCGPSCAVPCGPSCSLPDAPAGGAACARPSPPRRRSLCAAPQDSLLFNWLVSLYPAWATMSGADVHCSAKLAMAELLLSGCTCSSGERWGPRCCRQLPAACCWRARAARPLRRAHALVFPAIISKLDHLPPNSTNPCTSRPPLHLPKRRTAGRHHPGRPRAGPALPPHARHHDARQERG